MKSLLQRLKQLTGSFVKREQPASIDYEILTREAVPAETFSAWHHPAVSQRQHDAYRRLIEEMHTGNVRQDLQVAAEAIRFTGMKNPSLLEVGCGSGYYSEIMVYLLQSSIGYVGMDDSKAMIHLARNYYKDRPFLVGDAAAIPFEPLTFDIVFNGVSLMHILHYQEAIKESSRVTRRWCILHTVPLLRNRKTTFLRKQAYGEETIEIIFNEAEFLQMLENHGLRVRNVFESIPYNLQFLLAEPTETRTFVCETENSLQR